MTRHSGESEDVLADFAVEPRHDKETLERYLTAYPDLRTELLALTLELEFEETAESPLDLESPVVAQSWARFSQPLRALTPTSFSREVATSLGVKTAVLMQLRDRAVLFASIPEVFLTRLAGALNAGVEEVSAYLTAPRNLALGASYKAGHNPVTAQQMTLADAMTQCGHTPEEIAKLFEEA